MVKELLQGKSKIKKPRLGVKSEEEKEVKKKEKEDREVDEIIKSKQGYKDRCKEMMFLFKMFDVPYQ